VPAYIYPEADGRKEWQRLMDAASKVDVVVIVNPDSGPGIERNSDYTAVFSESRIRGLKLIGYVSTLYARRPRAEVKNDVDAWVRLYPQIVGFFFDQQPREAEHVGYYAELRDYAKEKLRDALVITSPGIPCDEAYFAQAISDATCVFSSFEGFETFELPPPLRAYEPGRFAALSYNVHDTDGMRAMVKEAIVKRIGYLYVSDLSPPNRWQRLPTYWEAEVEAVSRLH
jgi:hypothetical protein